MEYLMEQVLQKYGMAYVTYKVKTDKNVELEIIIIDSFILIKLNIIIINNRQERVAWPGPGCRTVAQAQCLQRVGTDKSVIAHPL